MAVFLVGGQSPMYTFRGNQELMDFFAAFYETGKPTAAVCHSRAILLDTKLSDGTLLVRGKKWTGFADSEEQYADQAVGQKIQPFWIETEARKLPNTTFLVKPAFTEYAVRDGNLITGQQQNSGAAASRGRSSLQAKARGVSVAAPRKLAGRVLRGSGGCQVPA